MRNDLLKRMIGITFGALLLLGASGQTFAQSSAQASSQSLGDAARAARKNKPQSDTTVRHYDNDNLPTTETLSVVGPEASAQPATAQEATAQQSSSSSAAATAAAAAEHKQSADDMQNKLDAQKAKIDSLSHELDLDQREYRLRAAAFYSDAGNRLRNAAEWDKEDAQYKTDMDSKQKSLDEAKSQLTDLQEQARKAGVREKESDGTAKDGDKGNGGDTDTAKK
jgi:hypothetical protein